MEAAASRAAKGGKPVVEIMIPLTVTREELALARTWVEDAIDAATKGAKKKIDVTIGTMVETPRAAIRADEIAEESDFFSFGTNDLTQMTFGFSRDDVGVAHDARLSRGWPAQAQPVRDDRPGRGRRARARSARSAVGPPSPG